MRIKNVIFGIINGELFWMIPVLKVIQGLWSEFQLILC